MKWAKVWRDRAPAIVSGSILVALALGVLLVFVLFPQKGGAAKAQMSAGACEQDFAACRAGCNKGEQSCLMACQKAYDACRKSRNPDR